MKLPVSDGYVGIATGSQFTWYGVLGQNAPGNSPQL